MCKISRYLSSTQVSGKIPSVFHYIFHKRTSHTLQKHVPFLYCLHKATNSNLCLYTLVAKSIIKTKSSFKLAQSLNLYRILISHQIPQKSGCVVQRCLERAMCGKNNRTSTRLITSRLSKASSSIC